MEAPAGVIFDLDGVLTMTASLHARAWKRMFDEYWAQCQGRGEPMPAPFDVATDYLRYVDGRPRLDGVRGFLAAREIHLPVGDPDDLGGSLTLFGLGKRKNEYYQALLETEGIETDPQAMALLQALRDRGRKLAVATSSRSGRLIVARAGFSASIDALVDGVDLTALGIAGKPAPDMFWEASRRLGLPPSQLALIEDAVAGVAAGRAGGFVCVVGVARLGNPEALRAAGAHVVVENLGELARRWGLGTGA